MKVKLMQTKLMQTRFMIGLLAATVSTTLPTLVYARFAPLDEQQTQETSPAMRATDQAIDQLLADILLLQIDSVSVREILKQTDPDRRFRSYLSRAHQIGGPRLIAQDIVQVRLEVSGTQTAKWLLQIVSESRGKSPIAIDRLESQLTSWENRTFVAVGTSQLIVDRISPTQTTQLPQPEAFEIVGITAPQFTTSANSTTPDLSVNKKAAIDRHENESVVNPKDQHQKVPGTSRVAWPEDPPAWSRRDLLATAVAEAGLSPLVTARAAERDARSILLRSVLKLPLRDVDTSTSVAPGPAIPLEEARTHARAGTRVDESSSDRYATQAGSQETKQKRSVSELSTPDRYSPPVTDGPRPSNVPDPRRGNSRDDRYAPESSGASQNRSGGAGRDQIEESDRYAPRTANPSPVGLPENRSAISANRPAERPALPSNQVTENQSRQATDITPADAGAVEEEPSLSTNEAVKIILGTDALFKNTEFESPVIGIDLNDSAVLSDVRVGDLMDDPRFADAVYQTIDSARLASTDYRADGSVRVFVSLDGRALWQRLDKAARGQ